MNRSERLQVLIKENAATVARIKEFSVPMINISVDMMQHKSMVENTMATYSLRALDEPGSIQYRDKTLAQFTDEFRLGIAFGLYNLGVKKFPRWFNSHWLNGNRSALKQRVMDKNINFFVENWLGVGMGEPNWYEMQLAHEAVTTGNFEEPLYGVYAGLFEEAQINTVGCFVEDYTKPTRDLNNFLLQ